MANSVKSNLQRSPTSAAYMKGWLMKQTHGICKSFQKRYFILYNEELRYYKNQNELTPLAIILLDHYTLVPVVQPELIKQNHQSTFCLISDDETKHDWPDYFLQAESENQKQIWIDCIQDLSRHSVSVLDKWLKRLEVSDNSLYSYNGQSDMSRTDDDSESTSSSTISPPSSNSKLSNHFFLRNYKSAESLGTTKSISSQQQHSERQRRPSNLSKSSSSSRKILSNKHFNRSSRCTNKSSSSSIISLPEESNEYFHKPMHTTKALEQPIIHPSEYNYDQALQLNRF
ncbi:hypothetical protein G6F37_009125 [Rhizopus arrhizus]|nr:hypothetical protein G6F38_010777 [Rhizopus arrhizus]KAG1154795.1 hypothetical protein G6F37_009125 [Rhizopus arrhizus]